MPVRASPPAAARRSARRRRCCPGSRARGIFRSPGKDGRRRRRASAGRSRNTRAMLTPIMRAVASDFAAMRSVASFAIALSTRPSGRRNFVRNCFSRLAICPLSHSWSYPRRCRMPCTTRIFTSWAGECPSSRAFCAAISDEMAISPAYCFAAPSSAGNESTSVGSSFPRKRRLRDFISALEVSSTLTLLFSPAARRARATKRSAPSPSGPATRF